MPERSNILFQINVTVPKGTFRFDTNSEEKFFEFGSVANDLNAFPSSAMNCFD